MDEESKDVFVLGIIKSRIKSFNKILKIAKVTPKELELVLEKLESRKLIVVNEKKDSLAKK